MPFARIRDFTGTKGLICPVGPAIGVPCAEAAVVHVDADEWQIGKKSADLLGSQRSRSARRNRDDSSSP